MEQSIIRIQQAGRDTAHALGWSPSGAWFRALVRLPGERRARTTGWFATRHEAQERAEQAVGIHSREGER